MKEATGKEKWTSGIPGLSDGIPTNVACVEEKEKLLMRKKFPPPSSNGAEETMPPIETQVATYQYFI